MFYLIRYISVSKTVITLYFKGFIVQYMLLFQQVLLFQLELLCSC